MKYFEVVFLNQCAAMHQCAMEFVLLKLSYIVYKKLLFLYLWTNFILGCAAKLFSNTKCASNKKRRLRTTAPELQIGTKTARARHLAFYICKLILKRYNLSIVSQVCQPLDQACQTQTTSRAAKALKSTLNWPFYTALGD